MVAAAKLQQLFFPLFTLVPSEASITANPQSELESLTSTKVMDLVSGTARPHGVPAVEERSQTFEVADDPFAVNDSKVEVAEAANLIVVEAVAAVKAADVEAAAEKIIAGSESGFPS